jgi:Tfp pilus assembly protein PilF/cold shock CspA family protein
VSVTAGPSSVADLLAEAERAASRKEWGRAAELTVGAGDSSEALDKRVFYLSRDKRYVEALTLLEQLRRREPDNFKWCYMTAYQYYVQEQHRDAIPWFRESVKRNPNHLKSWWRAANALAKTGDEKLASRCAAKVLRLWHDLPQAGQERDRPSFAKASYLLGKQQMRSDPHGAVPLLEQALANDPRDPYKHYRLGKALRYCGRAGEAVAHQRQAAKLKPGDVNIELELALSLARVGQAGEARQLLRPLGQRLRGWDLIKGGRLALDIDEAGIAVDLLGRARGDRRTSKDERVEMLLGEARAAMPAAQLADAQGSEKSTGRIDVVRPERNFGFLVGDDGTRRHFRLTPNVRFRRGDRVAFVAVAANKGPAARELEPL